MFGKKWKATKIFVAGVAGGFLGKFIYDEYVKGTPAVEVAKGKIHSAKQAACNVISLFEKEEPDVEEAEDDELEEDEEEGNVEDFTIDVPFEELEEGKNSTAIEQEDNKDIEE